jgi:hypothetical protein
VAQWGLQTYPGVTPAQALSDQQAADGQQTPLTATDLSWVDGSRLAGGQTAGFNGESTVITASTSVVDTAGSFSVAAWVKAESVPGCGAQAIASIADPDSAFSPFVLGLDCSTNTWRFRLADREVGTVVYADVASSQPAALGRWTHLAGVWDEPERTLKLYVDGVLAAAATPSAGWLATRGGGWTADGQFVLGRARVAGADKDPFRGELADVQVFNRALVDHDFTGQLATDADSGGVNEPGIVAPIEVGRWDFTTATPCYSPDLADTCEAADGGAWSRWLVLSRGTALTVGPDGGAAMDLDACYFPDENGGVCEATQEYGRSATKAGVDTTDPSYPKTIWHDAAVLRTDQSFTVAAWVLNRGSGANRAVLSVPGAHESAFSLAWDASGGGRWTFTVTDEDVAGSARAEVASPVLSDPSGAWTHLVAVYDAARSELRLYVDGVRVDRSALSFTPLSSANALQVGRALAGGSVGAYWHGGIDDVLVWQGAVSDGGVAELYAAQSF